MIEEEEAASGAEEDFEVYLAGLFTKCVEYTAFKLENCLITELPKFGGPASNSAAGYFEFTVIPEMLKQGLEKPPRLSKIETLGWTGRYLTKIQVFFEDGIESPMFGVHNSKAFQTEIYEVRQETVTSIEARPGGYSIYEMNFNYENTKESVFLF